MSFSGHVCGQFLSAAQPDDDALPVGGVGLLRLLDHGFEDDGLGKGNTLAQRILLPGTLTNVRTSPIIKRKNTPQSKQEFNIIVFTRNY